MGVSKYNSEGYYDPVVYEALTRIEAEERTARAAAAYRPLVYICSPYTGDVERNTFRARAFSRFAVERRDRTIHARMREYLYTLTHHPELTTSVLPLGDGVTLSVKREASGSPEQG